MNCQLSIPPALGPRLLQDEFMCDERDNVVDFCKTPLPRHRIDACVRASLFRTLFFSDDDKYNIIEGDRGKVIFNANKTLSAFRTTINEALKCVPYLKDDSYYRYPKDPLSSESRTFWIKREINEIHIILVPQEMDLRITFSGKHKKKIRVVCLFKINITTRTIFGLNLSLLVLFRIREPYKERNHPVIINEASKLEILREFELQQQLSRRSLHLLKPPKLLGSYKGKSAEKDVYTQPFFPVTFGDIIRDNSLFSSWVKSCVFQTYKLTPEILFLFIEQLLQSVEELHKKGYVHCDIKSDNVLVNPDPDSPIVYLTDYGICSSLGENFARLQAIFPHVDTIMHYGTATAFTDYWAAFRIMMELFIGPSFRRRYYDKDMGMYINFSGDRTNFIFYRNALQKMQYHVTFSFFRTYWKELQEKNPALPNLSEELQYFLDFKINLPYFTLQQLQEMERHLRDFCQGLPDPYSDMGNMLFALYEEFFQFIMIIHREDLVRGFPYMVDDKQKFLERLFIPEGKTKKELIQQLCKICNVEAPQEEVDNLYEILPFQDPIDLKDLWAILNNFKNRFEQLKKLL